VSLVQHLQERDIVIAAELRPPRAELAAAEGMDAWIDTYHAVRGLTRRGVPVFLTDSAVGLQEEDNLRHLIANLDDSVPRGCVVPFLTSKHPLEYCLSYSERAWQHDFTSLVVLGGDRHVGPPRCVEHAWQLRRAIREREPRLALGGWANPNADAARQVSFLADGDFTAEFYLTQVVSHHALEPVDRFLAATRAAGLTLPGMFGVFYYRSANPKTLEALSHFLPVPVEELTREFRSGASAVEVAARTIRSLVDLGVRYFYVSNLPLARAAETLDAIVERVGSRSTGGAHRSAGRAAAR
jgi:5,10-methylenetetrahydrofolate reductase